MIVLGTIGDDIKLTSDGWSCSDAEQQKTLEECFPLDHYGPEHGFFGYRCLEDGAGLIGLPFVFTGPRSGELVVDGVDS